MTTTTRSKASQSVPSDHATRDIQAQRPSPRISPATERSGPHDAVRADEGAPLVQKAVDALRQRILAASASEPFLGSEDELIAALGISRPTFRQAARLLEHEQLLKIKRGSGGGFFAQPPSARAVSRMAAIYLQSQNTTPQHVHDAFSPVLIEAAVLAARLPDSATRQRLADFVDQQAGFDRIENERQQLRVVLEFETLLGELCGNPAIGLIMSVMRDLVRDPRFGSFGLTPEQAKAYADFHRKLAQAVRLGDADMARLFARAHVAEVAGWNPAVPAKRRRASASSASES